MKIYHYHIETGAFLGEGVADQSPLEPGVWLIPAQATIQRPPDIEEGEHAIWTGERWEVQPIPEPASEPSLKPGPMTPEQKLEAVGLSVADLRQLLALEVTP